ncbi:MAG: hypothetical protein AAFY99_13200 [Pseudomonadota bacterium]
MALLNISAVAYATSVPFSGYVSGTGAGYVVQPAERFIFGESLAVMMEKRAHSGRDLVHITAESMPNGATVFSKRYEFNGNRQIVVIDGFDVGKSRVRLCVRSARLDKKQCFPLAVTRVDNGT